LSDEPSLSSVLRSQASVVKESVQKVPEEESACAMNGQLTSPDLQLMLANYTWHGSKLISGSLSAKWLLMVYGLVVVPMQSCKS
jgi:hypothetical protein